MTRGNGPMLSAVERVQLLRCEVVRRLVCGCEVGLYRHRAWLARLPRIPT